jgi:glc operon protein GlcG
MKIFIFFAVAVLSFRAYSAPKQPAVLTIDKAKKVSDKLIECAKKNNWKMSVAIVNSEGNLLYFLRDDGANVSSIDAALRKAKSSNNFQRPTKAFADSVKEGRVNLMSLDGIVAVEGGYPLIIDQQQVGAIGVSGARATEDDQCAKEAAASL